MLAIESSESGVGLSRVEMVPLAETLHNPWNGMGTEYQQFSNFLGPGTLHGAKTFSRTPHNLNKNVTI